MKYFSLPQQCILFSVAAVLLGILYLKFYYQPISSPSEELVKEVAVDVSGEVRSPGVYLFNNPPTLREAVERAGGLKETAQFDIPSSSEILETGTLLIVTKESSQIPPLRPLSKEEHGGPLFDSRNRRIHGKRNDHLSRKKARLSIRRGFKKREGYRGEEIPDP
jgi:hypothetical protein